MYKVAVVDDSGALRGALRNVLESSGFEVPFEAESSQELFARMKETPADLVLLDVFFPNENGLDMLARLKADYPNSRVLMITGLRQQNIVEEAKKRGANGLLYKPFDADGLIAAIERLRQ